MANTKATGNGLEDNLPLKEFIRAVQAELIESEREREESNTPPLFKVDSLEIEASVVASKRVEGKGGINIQVVSLGGGGHVEEQAVQKLKLTLSAMDETDIAKYNRKKQEMISSSEEEREYNENESFSGEHPIVGPLPQQIGDSM